MNIDILTISEFASLNIMAPRGHQQSGGGMACLMNAAKAALSDRYRVTICTDFSELQGDIVIVDALYITNNFIEGLDAAEIIAINLAALEKDRATHPNRKYLLWCAEKTVCRILPFVRERLFECVDCLLVTDPYIYNLFRAINVVPIGYLCDAIDPDLFRPAKKELVVTAVGALKHIKNVDWILEVYKRLEGKIKRMYLGSAALWSKENREEDARLLPKIKAVTDEYHPNASPIEVAYHNSYAAFAVNNTWHDCSSRANEELLASGVISIHGEHDLFTPRPGFTVKTPEEAVAKIAELTNDFTELPDPALHEASRTWALKHVAVRRFQHQFQTTLGYFL